LEQWKFAEPNANEFISTVFGSGYTSDPNTIEWLNNNIESVFGYPGIVRFSWSTVERILEEKAASVVWYEEDEEKIPTLDFQSTSHSLFSTRLGLNHVTDL
jgi:ribonuclease H2 subunit A